MGLFGWLFGKSEKQSGRRSDTGTGDASPMLPAVTYVQVTGQISNEQISCPKCSSPISIERHLHQNRGVCPCGIHVEVKEQFRSARVQRLYDSYYMPYRVYCNTYYRDKEVEFSANLLEKFKAREEMEEW